MSLEKVTPQLAKLLVLKLMHKSLTQLKDDNFWELPAMEMSKEDQANMAEATQTQLDNLKNSIVYQEKLCK